MARIRVALWLGLGTPRMGLGYPPGWDWHTLWKVHGTRGWGIPRKDMGHGLGKDLRLETGVPPPPRCGRTNKVKTLPSLALRTQAVINLSEKVCQLPIES